MGDLATNQYPVKIGGKITTVSIRGAVGELLVNLLLVKLGVHPEAQQAKKSAHRWIQDVVLSKPEDFDGGLSEFVQERIVFELLDPRISKMRERLDKKLKKEVDTKSTQTLHNLLKTIQSGNKLPAKDIAKLQKAVAMIKPSIMVEPSTKANPLTAIEESPEVETSINVDISTDDNVSPKIEALTEIEHLPKVETSIKLPVSIETSTKSKMEVTTDFASKKARKRPQMVKSGSKQKEMIECASGYRTGNLFGLKLAELANKRVCWKLVA